MKVRVQVIIETQAGEPVDVHDIACIQREKLRPDTVGLTLEEAKTILERIQQRIVEQQAAEYLCTQRHCPDCGNKRYHKGEHRVTIRTLFGKLRFKSPRFYHCQCQPHPTQTFSPLAERLPERSTPELLYLEPKWASLMSYGLTTKLLDEVLPIGKHVNAKTVRNHLHAVAERTEAKLGDERMFFVDGCPQDWANLPRPDGPLTVGLDDGYVHSCDKTSRKDGWFEVIAGKSVTAKGAAKCFAFVHRYDTKPKRRGKWGQVFLFAFEPFCPSLRRSLPCVTTRPDSLSSALFVYTCCLVPLARSLVCQLQSSGEARGPHRYRSHDTPELTAHLSAEPAETKSSDARSVRLALQ